MPYQLVRFIIMTVVVSGSELTDSDWDQRLRTCLAEAENFQPPSEIFAVR